MPDLTRQASRSVALSAKLAQLMQKRLTIAQEHFTERARKACETYGQPAARPKTPVEIWPKRRCCPPFRWTRPGACAASRN